MWPLGIDTLVLHAVSITLIALASTSAGRNSGTVAMFFNFGKFCDFVYCVEMCHKSLPHPRRSEGCDPSC